MTAEREQEHLSNIWNFGLGVFTKGIFEILVLGKYKGNIWKFVEDINSYSIQAMIKENATYNSDRSWPRLLIIACFITLKSQGTACSVIETETRMRTHKRCLSLSLIICT